MIENREKQVYTIAGLRNQNARNAVRLSSAVRPYYLLIDVRYVHFFVGF